MAKKAQEKPAGTKSGGKKRKMPASKYINPLTDFGFTSTMLCVHKRIFGDKASLLAFLNAILNIEGGIVDLTYINTEKIAHAEEERTARYDLHYCSYFQLMNTDTKEIFSDKLLFVVLELPLFNKTEEQLLTDMDKWMFVIKNLSNLKDLPAVLRNEVFEQLFHTAEVAKLSAGDRRIYYSSLKSYWDMNNYFVQKEQEIAGYKQERAGFQQQIFGFQQQVAGYQQREAGFQQQVAGFQQEVVDYQQREAGFQQKIAELEQRLGLNDTQEN